VNGTGSGSFLVARFGISGVEHSGCAARMLGSFDGKKLIYSAIGIT
jgi:hypothetical protein